MNEFLNPKSMATPGAAGAMVMFVANSICFQFPEVEFRWAAIVLSLLAGAIVFSAKQLHISHRVAFWVLNSLIIFSVGVGTSNIAAKVQQPTVEDHLTTENSLLELILPSAHAQENSVSTETEPMSNTIELQLAAISEQLEKQTQAMLDLQDENKILRAELVKLRSKTVPVQFERPQNSNKATSVKLRSITVPIQFERPQKSNIAQPKEERKLQQVTRKLEEQAKLAAKQQKQAETAQKNAQYKAEKLASERKVIEKSQRDGFFKRW